MRKIKLIVLAPVAICLLASLSALAMGGKGGNGEEQIKTLQRQMIEADLKGDISFLEKHFADDATIIYGSGKMITKAERIEAVKSGALKYESYDVHDSKIRVDGNTAVVTELGSFKGLVNGKPFSGDLRNTRVWIKQKGSWNCVLFQTTRVAPPSQ